MDFTKENKVDHIPKPKTFFYNMSSSSNHRDINISYQDISFMEYVLNSPSDPLERFPEVQNEFFFYLEQKEPRKSLPQKIKTKVEPYEEYCEKELNSWLKLKENEIETNNPQLSSLRQQFSKNMNNFNPSCLNIESLIKTTSSFHSHVQEPQVVENIERVIVHCGSCENKTFQLTDNILTLFDQNPTTISIRLFCRQKFTPQYIKISHFFEYKSYRKIKKSNENKNENFVESIWLPYGYCCKNKSNEKCLYAIKSDQIIDIDYYVKYDMKKMNKSRKKYIRVRFKIEFSPCEYQEIAIPMVCDWDWDSRCKKKRKYIHVKELICEPPPINDVFSSPLVYYILSDDDDDDEVCHVMKSEEYEVSVEPIYISQRFGFNGRRGEYKQMLLNLLKKVKLPVKYLREKSNYDKTIVHLCLMNGVDPKADGLEYAKIVKLENPNNQSNFLMEKQTRLAQVVVNTCPRDCICLIYDMNRKVVTDVDVINAFLFVVKQAKQFSQKCNFIVNVTWYYSQGGRNKILENTFREIQNLKNVVIFSSAGNKAEYIQPYSYPTCIPIDQNVCKIGALKHDNLTPQEFSNLGCDLYVWGSTTSVAAVNTAVVSGYLWRIFSKVSNKQFLSMLLTEASSVSNDLRILNNASVILTNPKKRKFEHILLPPSPVVVDNRFNYFGAVRKRRKVENILRQRIKEDDLKPLLNKISLIRDILIKVKSYIIKKNEFSISADTMTITKLENRININLSKLNRYNQKVRYIFTLYQINNMISGVDLTLALDTFGLDSRFVNTNVKLNIVGFAEIVSKLILPHQFLIDISGEKDGPNDVKAIGVVINEILKDEMTKLIPLPDVLYKIIYRLVYDSTRGNIIIDSLFFNVESIMGMLLEAHRTKIEKYCEDVVGMFNNHTVSETSSIVELLLRGKNDGMYYTESRTLTESTNFIAVGPPGSGKSCLLKRLAVSSALLILQNNVEYPLPVFVPLMSYIKSGGLANYLKTAYSDYPFLSYILCKGTRKNLLFLMDGIDEISQFTDIAARSVDFIRGVRTIITSRECAEYLNNNVLKTFTVLQIQPLNNFQQKCLIEKRLQLIGDTSMKEQLFEIVNFQIVKSFVKFPSLLSLLISTIIVNKELDASNSLLIGKILLKHLICDFQLQKIEKVRMEYETNKTVTEGLHSLIENKSLEFIERFAYILFCKKKTTRFKKVLCEVEELDKYGILCKMINTLIGLCYLPLFVKISGNASNGIYSFVNESVQTHLASRYLIRKIQEDFKKETSSDFKQQKAFDKVFEKHVGDMIGDSWFLNLILHIGNGLGKEEFIGLIHFLQKNESNKSLCSLLIYERSNVERKDIIQNELSKYTFNDEIVLTVKSGNNLKTINNSSSKKKFFEYKNLQQALYHANSFNQMIKVKIVTNEKNLDKKIIVTSDNISIEGKTRQITENNLINVLNSALNSTYS